MDEMRVLTEPIWRYSESAHEWEVLPSTFSYFCSSNTLRHKRLHSMLITYDPLTAFAKYVDVSRWKVVDEKGIPFESAFACSVLDDLYPIKFPYYGERNTAHCSRFLCSDDWPELWPQYDTFAILYICREYHTEHVNKYYKAVVDDTVPKWMTYRERLAWEEIPEKEYNLRKKGGMHA